MVGYLFFADRKEKNSDITSGLDQVEAVPLLKDVTDLIVPPTTAPHTKPSSLMVSACSLYANINICKYM
jgi:hypothetical protein